MQSCQENSLKLFKQKKPVAVQNWFTRLSPTRPPNLERDLMAENESVCFPFDRGNTLHNQQENILLSLRERSQTNLSQKV